MASFVAAIRPLVNVQSLEGDMATDGSNIVPHLDVMKVAIRHDIINFVHSNISKNRFSINQKRFAVSFALVASAIPSLVLAHGHRIESVPELPLVISNFVQFVEKTTTAIKVLR
ncbi:hypothetical protein AAC387_Pa03g1765 [Persea americana]